MRRGQHTSRVLDAMRVPEQEAEPVIPVTGDSGGDTTLDVIAGV